MVGDGPDTTLATVVGLDGELTPLTGDGHLLARQLGGTTVLTLWRWQTAGTPPDDIRSWPDSFAVDAGSAGRMTAVAIGEGGDLGYALVDEAGATRFASVRVAVVASAASARTAFDLTASTDAAATSPPDAATAVHRDDGAVTAVRGSCLLALLPDGDPLAPADEAALLDAVFAPQTSGACDE